MVAEVRETFVAACGLFSASGYVQEAVLTDYVLERSAPSDRGSDARGEGFVIPVTIDDLAANDLLEQAPSPVCWERSVETLTARKDDIAGLAVASDERIEAYVLYSPAAEMSVAPLVCRGRRRSAEATARRTPRARDADLAVPQSSPGGVLKGVAGGARFPARRRASAVRSEGAVRLKPFSLSCSEPQRRIPAKLSEIRAVLFYAEVRTVLAKGANGVELALTPDQIAGLDRRLVEHQADPGSARSWDDVEKNLRNPGTAATMASPR